MVLMLNLCCIWLMMIFKCNLFILVIKVLLVLGLVLVLKVGFFLESFCKVMFILFWLVLVLGLMVIWIIGLGNFIDFK